MKTRRLVICMLAFVSLNGARPWGFDGHKLTGEVADHYLTVTARQAIALLLPGQSLADIANWADDFKKEPQFSHLESWRWHFLNVEDDVPYVPHPEGNDLYTRLLYFEERLKNTSLSTQQRAEALKFYVHFIGDMHQPLHVGKPSDQGGNAVKVSWRGEETQLHGYWDWGIICAREPLTSQQLVAAISHEDVWAWQQGNYLDWLAESRALRSQIYQFKDGKLDEIYYERNIPVVEERLRMAGVRIASRLNEIFK